MASHLTRSQVRRVDELAVSRYGMVGLQLMENAGRNAAEIIDTRYGPRGAAFIACGGGNNGGDGFVIARHLHNRDWSVTCILAATESKLSPDCATNFGIVRKMDLPVRHIMEGSQVPAAMSGHTVRTVFVDALLGTGFSGEVRSPMAELIATLNAAPRRAMVAIDVPSGFDCDSGAPASVNIRADLTITFVASKIGFQSPGAQAFTGEVVVADIGAPTQLLTEVESC